MPAVPTRGTKSQQAPIRILLLEDAPATAMILRAYLAVVAPGASVETECTLSGALARLARGGLDLVLADLNLPDSAGTATLSRILQATDLLVIVITSDEGAALREDCLEIGAYDFLHKSRINRDALRGILRLATLQANTFRSLRDLNRTLEARVAERSAELQAAMRELETFSYSISHDLSAPLRAIAGMCGMLREDFGNELVPGALGLVDRMDANARRMGEMIAGLLQFSRAASAPVTAQAVDMRAQLDLVLGDFAAAGETRPRIVVGPLPPALGDATLLRQVWQNLVGNALKFASRVHDPVVEIGARAQGDMVEYWVRDNGAGFDARSRERLFKVFQRAHSQSEFAGTGIGLAIVRRIVERHRGSVEADGAPGEGAEFRFRLRAAPGEAPVAAMDAPQTSATLALA